MSELSGIWAQVSENLVDTIVYAAIAVVTLIGFVKCILPLRRSAHCFRRAIRTLDKLPARDSMRPVWQNELFMGKKMRGAWRRFLHNAEQLDARGLTCDVREYINDDTAIYEFSNIPLSEMVPGLLTSLGILGTFIGLMRGLGGLDVSDAAKTMESIPAMIGGMTFAFATSIAGVSCSLAFNILNRMAMGGATRALDEFQDAFTELVMQTPLNDDTQAICQREDQTAFLRRAVSDLSDHVADKVSGAVEHSLVPVTQAMNNFIMGQTQSQLEGVHVLTQRFIESMNTSLSGQFLQLGQTLTQINRSQKANFEAMDKSVASVTTMLENLAGVQQMTGEIAQRFESYVQTLADSRQMKDEFTKNASELVASMSHAAREYNDSMDDIRKAQKTLQDSLSNYALRSKQTMQLICDRADQSGQSSTQMAKEMKDSAKMLKDSYASFVENIASGLSRTMGLLDQNMNDLMNALEKRLVSIEKGGSDSAVTSLSHLEQMLASIQETLEKSTVKEG